MSTAAERVRAEVSGLPPGKWERRLFMVLQVFVDEAGSAPNQKMIVMGGLLSTAKKWGKFAARWETALKESETTPKIEAVKYREIARMKGQFDPSKGWTEGARDAKLAELIGIIKDCCIAYASVSMRWDHFQKHIGQELAGRRTLLVDAPNVITAIRMAIPVSRILNARKLLDRCDFYFDETDGHDALILALWPKIKEAAAAIPTELLRRGSSPQFGRAVFQTDDQFLPLQGADLIAGMVRDVHLTGGAHPAFLALKGMTSDHYTMDEARVAEAGNFVKEHQEFCRKRGYPMFGPDPAIRRKQNRQAQKLAASKTAGDNSKATKLKK